MSSYQNRSRCRTDDRTTSSSSGEISKNSVSSPVEPRSPSRRTPVPFRTRSPSESKQTAKERILRFDA
nr:MAG TPA: hypothetical protein [Caudoviricetes sp.]